MNRPCSLLDNISLLTKNDSVFTMLMSVAKCVYLTHADTMVMSGTLCVVWHTWVQQSGEKSSTSCSVINTGVMNGDANYYIYKSCSVTKRAMMNEGDDNYIYLSCSVTNPGSMMNGDDEHYKSANSTLLCLGESTQPFKRENKQASDLSSLSPVYTKFQS